MFRIQLKSFDITREIFEALQHTPYNIDEKFRGKFLLCNPREGAPGPIFIRTDYSSGNGICGEYKGLVYTYRSWVSPIKFRFILSTLVGIFFCFLIRIEGP